jgi:pyruvate dehydrogenase E2 component (dihydrolipoamide acetyltransferase)
MARLLRMPEVAANTLEATLSDWPLGESAEFADGDAIATVETDKAVVDVPAEGGGVIVRTLVEPGATVAVGAPMALLADPGEEIGDVDAVLRELGGGSDAPVLDDPADTVELNGQTPPESVVGTAASGARIFASPLARRLARELGLSLEELSGTGPGGRVVRDDVRRAAAARDAAPAPAAVAAPAPVAPAPAAPAPAAPAPAAPVVSTGDYEDVPHTRMRRAIASRLAESNREAPAFQIRGSARVDALLALRKELNEGATTKVSVNDLVVAAAARTHAALPELNVIWTPDAVRRFRTVDVAVAVATDKGLVTPVLRDVGNRTVSSIAAANADLVERARAGTLRQDELEGGALTVSNLGGFGTEDFTAVINPPQAAILAVGAARQEAVVTDGELGVATVLRVTLSVDHRPIDGATAARWMKAFLALLESPLRILA